MRHKLLKIIIIVVSIATLVSISYIGYKLYNGKDGVLPTQEEVIDVPEKLSGEAFDYFVDLNEYKERLLTSFYGDEDAYNSYITAKYGDERTFEIKALTEVIRSKGSMSSDEATNKAKAVLEEIESIKGDN